MRDKLDPNLIQPNNHTIGTELIALLQNTNPVFQTEINYHLIRKEVIIIFFFAKLEKQYSKKNLNYSFNNRK